LLWRARTPGAEKFGSSLDVCRGVVQQLDGIMKNLLEAIRPKALNFQAPFNLIENAM